jgi:hypothetical protein
MVRDRRRYCRHCLDCKMTKYRKEATLENNFLQ